MFPATRQLYSAVAGAIKVLGPPRIAVEMQRAVGPKQAYLPGTGEDQSVVSVPCDLGVHVRSLRVIVDP